MTKPATKPSPGPWYRGVQFGKPGRVRQQVLAEDNTGQNFCICETQAENAPLIAAAPALYKALTHLLALAADEFPESQWADCYTPIIEAQAALKLARGETDDTTQAP